MKNIEQRTYDIVEELRADIDFELDDVIAKIVGGLPEDYFKSLSRNDQLMQLKALLAMGVCNLDQEIMVRSETGRHIGVVSRQNYPGLLANILKRLPAEQPLVGAKVFTSKDHDFIIDLFEFETENECAGNDSIHPYEVEETVERLNVVTRKPFEELHDFIGHYRANSSILRSPDTIADHLSAFDKMTDPEDAVVHWASADDEFSRVTIAAGNSSARHVFQHTASFLGEHSLDVEQAFLHDMIFQGKRHVAIASFVVTGSSTDVDRSAVELRQFLLQAE